MKFKKEHVFYLLPFIIALSRIIHLLKTGYILPDESNYSSMSILWHATDKIMIDQGRVIYQYILLFFSMVLGLDNIIKMVSFMSLANSILASLSLWLCNKVLEKLYPEFKDRWFILLLFFLAPMYTVLMGLGITEISSIFLITLAIYVYYYEKSSIIFGLLIGMAYSLRLPFLLIVLFFFAEFIYYKKWKDLLKYSVGIIPFFYFPYNILGGFSLKKPLITTCLNYLVSSGTQTQFKYSSPAILKIFPSLPNFFINNVFCIVIGGLFSIGLISSFLTIISIYKKKINKWQLLSIGLLIMTSIYISRYDAYSYNRMSRIGTIARLSVVGIFGIMFLPNLLVSTKNIKRLAILSLIVTGGLYLPFMSLGQSNLSKYYIDRLSLNYKAPWLISQNILRQYENTNSLVFCEPINRIRLFKIENITYIQLPRIETKAFQLIEEYDYVFIYLEINVYFGLVGRYDWLYEYLQTDNYSFVYENDEFVLIRMI